MLSYFQGYYSHSSDWRETRPCFIRVLLPRNGPKLILKHRSRYVRTWALVLDTSPALQHLKGSAPHLISWPWEMLSGFLVWVLCPQAASWGCPEPHPASSSCFCGVSGTQGTAEPIRGELLKKGQKYPRGLRKKVWETLVWTSRWEEEEENFTEGMDLFVYNNFATYNTFTAFIDVFKHITVKYFKEVNNNTLINEFE